MGLYSLATQATCLVAMTAAVTRAAFAQPFFLIWTGDARLAHQAAPILTAYVLGRRFTSRSQPFPTISSMRPAPCACT